MTRYEELRQLMIASDQIYRKHRQWCWQSAATVANSLREYLGKEIVRYFRWEDDDEGIDPDPLTTELSVNDAGYWNPDNPREFIVGISVRMDVGMSFEVFGYKLTLVPSDGSVSASMFGKLTATLVPDDNKMQFADDAQRDALLAAVYDDLKANLGTPIHLRPDNDNPRRRIGFYQADE